MSDEDEPDLEAVDSARQRQKLVADDLVDDTELRHLIEASSELLAILDFDRYFCLLNKAWEYTLGYSRDELRSKPFLEFVHPDDRSKTATTAERIKPDVQLISFQNRYIAKDGREVPLRWRAVVSSERGRYYCAAQDMSEVLAAREQSAALDALCELSSDAVLMQSADGLITRWDGAGPRLFGWDAGAVVGRPLSELLERVSGGGVDLFSLLEDADEADDALLEDLDDDRQQARLRKPDGSRVEVSLTIREFGNGARVTGALALLRPA